MKKIFLILIFCITSYGVETLKPSYSLLATSGVQSMVLQNNTLYAGTEGGTVEIFDITKRKIIKTVTIPSIKDFMGESIRAKVYSVDVLDDMILITSQGEKGYRNLYMYQNNQLKNVITVAQKMFIQKANFVSKDKIIFALLSNQIGLYDIKTNKQSYLTQVSASAFSHFILSEDKKTIASTDESGIVRILDVATGKIMRQLTAINLDKVYQLDYKQGMILTAGQDRKAVLYQKNKSYSLDFTFLLYSCALSPKATLGAIAYNENNEVLVFNTLTKTYLYNLRGQEATMTQILFHGEDELFISSDSKKINYFKLGKKR